MSETNAASADEPFFRALLTPHRSLGRTGFMVLMGALIFGWLATGAIFLSQGAWPVFGFFGLDVLLIYVAFRLNYRSGRAYERVRLTERQLEVMRVGPGGEVGRWEFEPTWLQISMDNPPRHDSQLRLTSHGRSLVIGAFLTPAERVEVADALRNAIAEWRNRWSRAFAR